MDGVREEWGESSSVLTSQAPSTARLAARPTNHFIADGAADFFARLNFVVRS